MIDFCTLARHSLTYWLRYGKPLAPTVLAGQRAACFVSLHDRQGQLRGCIGTLEPVRDDLTGEVIENAVSAGTRDPRFPPVSLTELDDLRIEVSVLQKPEPVADASQLDPSRFGVIVQSEGKRGVLLPAIEGIDTTAKQLEIVRKKASIPMTAAVQLWRFEVEKHHEPN